MIIKKFGLSQIQTILIIAIIFILIGIGVWFYFSNIQQPEPEISLTPTLSPIINVIKPIPVNFESLIIISSASPNYKLEFNNQQGIQEFLNQYDLLNKDFEKIEIIYFFAASGSSSAFFYVFSYAFFCGAS